MTLLCPPCIYVYSYFLIWQAVIGVLLTGVYKLFYLSQKADGEKNWKYNTTGGTCLRPKKCKNHAGGRYMVECQTCWVNTITKAGKCEGCVPEERGSVHFDRSPGHMRKKERKSLSHVQLFAIPWTVASSVHEIFPGKSTEWVSIFFSRGSSQHRDRTWVSCTADRHFPI